MIESIFSSTAATISVANFMICMGSGIILGIIIALIHKFTTKTTPNFLITLAVLPVLVQVVILLVNGNLGTSLAVAGAFSLIRFRSMPGNSKEIISVFEVFDGILQKYTNKHELVKVKTTNMGSMYELRYEVSLKKNISKKDFLDEIRVKNGNMLVMLERPELSGEEL